MKITKDTILLFAIVGIIFSPKAIFTFNVANTAITIPISASPATSPDAKSTPFSTDSDFFLHLFELLSTNTLNIPPVNIALFKDIGK